MEDWEDSLRKGKIKEQIFKEDFLEYFTIGYIDISNQKKEYDLEVKELVSVDVKSYKDNGTIPIEEMSIVETKKSGWFYSSPAKYFAFVSSSTRTMLLLKNDDALHKWYKDNIDRFESNSETKLRTDSTNRNGRRWHSTHRNIPLAELNIAWYKKNRPKNQLKII